MMHALFSQKGATFNVEILADKPAQDFISAHAAVLDGSFEQVPMSDAMRRRLTRSDYIFSGIKTFHELNEAFPSLLDENGDRKPFEQFLKDVRTIDKEYNSSYLRAEYSFAHASATMAAKWEEFQQDGDRYNLQYRTAGDDKVRPAHAALNGITLPPSDSFWADYCPPNGWNCRCTVVQVRKSKYPATPHDEAMSLGEEALGGEKHADMFRFNSGLRRQTFPDYNPYTIRRCNDCDIAKGRASESSGKLTWQMPSAADLQPQVKGNIKLAKAFIPESQLCAACKLLRVCDSQRTMQAFQDYRKELRGSVQILSIESPNLETGTFYQSKKSFKNATAHAHNIEELEMHANIFRYIDKLTHVRTSPLGEGKDMTNPKHIANINKKKNRGVTRYEVYHLQLGSVTWEVKTEVYKNRKETPYNIRRIG